MKDTTRERIKGVFKKIARAYTGVAVILFHTLVLFVLLNAVLLVVFRIKDRFREKGLAELEKDHDVTTAVYMKYGEALLKVHPDLTQEDVELLLREMEAVKHEYEPFTQYREAPYTGKWVTVDVNGFRHVKRQGPWPPDARNLNVFVFGGSTTFGQGVTNGQTIASYLEEELQTLHPQKDVRVYNFGRRGYYSNQERVLLERLLLTGHVPDVALFIDGVNDFLLCWNDEPIFTQGLKDVVSGKGPKPHEALLSELPATRAARSAMRRLEGGAGSRPAGSDRGEEAGAKGVGETAAEVLQRYWRNKEFVEKVCTTHGVAPVFVWQPMPYYKYNLEHHLLGSDPLVAREWPLISEGYSLMAKEVEEGSPRCTNNFLWLAGIQEQSKESLYVDPWHYTAKFSQQLAVTMSRLIIERDLVDAGTERKGIESGR